VTVRFNIWFPSRGVAVGGNANRMAGCYGMGSGVCAVRDALLHACAQDQIWYLDCTNCKISQWEN
jgi:hypothetical protein